jgi:transcription elongation factor Elf1
MNLKRLMVCGNRIDNGEAICGLLVDAVTEMGSDRIIKAAIKPTPTECHDVDPETLEPMGINAVEFSEVKTACGYEESLAYCEAYMKTVPRPPITERHAVGNYRCPSCGVYFVGESIGQLTNYCGNCGQRLDLEVGQ